MNAKLLKFQFCEPSLAIFALARTLEHEADEELELVLLATPFSPANPPATPLLPLPDPIYLICISYVSPGQSLENPINSFEMLKF